jgi:acetylornithine deacetylase/succinyl-diaminopimelate desuccinylase-like protein
MEHVLHESIIPYLQKRFNLNEVIKVRVIHCAGLGEGAIDEKITDLEKLSNPTVGLAAHTGVVDIRIAAKAKSESEANAMIAEVEAQVRERLGAIVFGVDEEKLENVVLDLVARRGWKLTAIESGLDGRMPRVPHAASFSNLTVDALTQALRAAQSESKAEVALGVATHPEERSADMMMILPSGEKTHHITYGGPPRSLPRWAANLALNWLRTTLEEMG